MRPLISSGQTKLFWLSFDLGVRGDYDTLYKWLGKKKAVECGDNIACFKFTSRSHHVSKIQGELVSTLSLKAGDRLYLIWIDRKEIRAKGRFIFGSRKSAVWEKYYPSVPNKEDDSL